MNKLARILF